MTKRKCLLNTRPLEQGIALNKSLAKIGWQTVHWPALIIQPIPSIWVNEMPDLELMHIAIFISQNAVHFYFKTLHAHNIKWPDKIQTIAVGPASADALREYNIQSTLVPMTTDSETLLQLPALNLVENHNILLIKGNDGRDLIEQTLYARGSHIFKIEVYKRIAPAMLSDELIHLWQKDAIDLILFTSQQSIHNLWFLLEKTAKQWMCRTPCLVVSPRLDAIARSYGIVNIVQTTWPKMLNTIKEFPHGV